MTDTIKRLGELREFVELYIAGRTSEKYTRHLATLDAALTQLRSIEANTAKRCVEICDEVADAESKRYVGVPTTGQFQWGAAKVKAAILAAYKEKT